MAWRLYKFLFIVLAVLVSLPLDAVAQEDGASDTGIFLFSLTTGARLIVDGTEIGVVPIDGIVPLSPGQHTVKLIRRGFAHRTEVIELVDGEELELEWDLVPFAGVVKISSNAGKAQLWLNDKPYGELPFDGEIPMGKHTIKIVASGFTPVERAIDIDGGEEYEFSLEMKAAPVLPVQQEKKDGLLSQWWFWTATGAVVVGGIVTGMVLASGAEAEPPPTPEGTLVF